MELQTVRKLLVKHLEGDVLTDKEGEHLLTGMEHLIEQQTLEQLAGTPYRLNGEKDELSAEELQSLYWEIEMYYGIHEEHDHHHDHEEEDDKVHKWGWLYMLITGLLAGMAYFLIRKYKF